MSLKQFHHNNFQLIAIVFFVTVQLLIGLGEVSVACYWSTKIIIIHYFQELSEQQFKEHLNHYKTGDNGIPHQTTETEQIQRVNDEFQYLHNYTLNFLHYEKFLTSNIFNEFNTIALSKLGEILDYIKRENGYSLQTAYFSKCDTWYRYALMESINLTAKKYSSEVTVCSTNLSAKTSKLPKSYFFPISNEMIRQSFASQNQIIYTFSNQNPVTELEQSIEMLKFTLDFSKEHWPETKYNLGGEVNSIASATDNGLESLDDCIKNSRYQFDKEMNEIKRNLLMCGL